jgi:hypothetical protein
MIPMLFFAWTIKMRRNKDTAVNPFIRLVKEKSYFAHAVAACHTYFSM